MISLSYLLLIINLSHLSLYCCNWSVCYSLILDAYYLSCLRNSNCYYSNCWQKCCCCFIKLSDNCFVIGWSWLILLLTLLCCGRLICVGEVLSLILYLGMIRCCLYFLMMVMGILILIEVAYWRFYSFSLSLSLSYFSTYSCYESSKVSSLALPLIYHY